MFATNIGTSPNNSKLTKDFEQAVQQGPMIMMVRDHRASGAFHLFLIAAGVKCAACK
jgi:hypothetical protein